jgi:hypothetical protein
VIARVKQLVQEKKTAENAALLDVTPARGTTITEEPPVEKSFEVFHKLQDGAARDPEPAPKEAAPPPGPSDNSANTTSGLIHSDDSRRQRHASRSPPA